MKYSIHYSFLILIFVTNNFKGQLLNLTISKSEYRYEITNAVNPLKITIEIRNISNCNVGFVLEKNTLGRYYLQEEYIFGKYIQNNLEIYDNIFAPRIVMYNHMDKKPLLWDNLKSSPNYTEDYMKKLIKENENKRKIIEKNLIEYGEKFFPNKNINFIERAKYVNDNFIVIESKQSLIFEIEFDPQLYIFDDSGSGYGFLIEKNMTYDFIVKIHNDMKILKKYLNSDNMEKILKEKIRIQQKDLVSKKLFLITS